MLYLFLNVIVTDRHINLSVCKKQFQEFVKEAVWL